MFFDNCIVSRNEAIKFARIYKFGTDWGERQTDTLNQIIKRYTNYQQVIDLYTFIQQLINDLQHTRKIIYRIENHIKQTK